MKEFEGNETDNDSRWFNMPRDFLDSAMWLEEPFTRPMAWIDLIGNARSEPGTYPHSPGLAIHLSRGELAIPEIRLSNRWKWSRGKVRRYLRALIQLGQIEIRSVQGSPYPPNIIRIINYDLHQPKS